MPRPTEQPTERDLPEITELNRVALNPGDVLINLSVRCELEDGDLAKLVAGGRVWVTFWGGITPFALTVVDQDGRQ